MKEEHYHVVDNTTGKCVICDNQIEGVKVKEQFDDMWCQDSWFPGIQYVEKHKRVLFNAIKGTLTGTVAIFPLDDFSTYIISEELYHSDALDEIYNLLPDNEKYLVEYHSRYDGVDNVDVWYSIVRI